MKINDFRMGWRLLARQPGYSAVSIAGLAIGFAVCLLVLVFARFSFNYNSSVPRLEQVYILKLKPNWGTGFWSEVAPLPLRDALEASGLPLQVAGLLEHAAPVRVGDAVQVLDMPLVDAALAPMFGIRAIEGDLQAALTRPDALALSQAGARRLFGDAHATGKSVQINGQPLVVVAVVADPPGDSSIRYEALVGFASLSWPASERRMANDIWRYYDDGVEGRLHSRVFVRIAGAAPTPQQLEALLQDAIARSPLRAHLGEAALAELAGKPALSLKVGPLADSYLDSEARANSGPKGDRSATFAVMAVALLLLLLAAGNYVSLATIRTIARQREIAIRKVMGVSSIRLAGQMMAESMLVALLAAAAGMLLAWLLLPAWADMTGMDFPGVMTRADWAALVLAALAMGLAIGAAASLQPSLAALKMRILDALGGRGRTEAHGALWLRRVVTVLQFAIAMFVGAMSLTLTWQIDYLRHIDYGYPIDQIVGINLAADLSAAEVHSLRQELAQASGIEGVAMAAPFASSAAVRRGTGQAQDIDVLAVSREYFATMGFKAAAGRLFDAAIDPEDNAASVVLNGAAVRQLGFADNSAALGQVLILGGKPVQVVGVARDPARGFFHGPAKPKLYAVSQQGAQLKVRMGTDRAAASATIEQAWRRHFPNQYLSLVRERAIHELNESGPLEILKTCLVAVFIMVPLAVTSIYILSAHAVQRRALEIVMRKLYGAGRADIARLLGREFVLLVGVAALIGLPPAYFAGAAFMGQFEASVNSGIPSLVAALAGATLIAALATLRHTLRATRIAPASVLRNA